MKAYYLLALSITLALLYTLRPVDYADHSAELDVSGVVEEVKTPCCGDVNISIAGDDRMYYLNRALYHYDDDILSWKESLEGQHIELIGVDHSSLLNPESGNIPVKLLVKDDEVLFSVDRETTTL